MSDNEVVDTSGASIKQKHQKKELLSLKNVVQKLEEDKLELKMQLHKQKHGREIDSYRSEDENVSIRDQIKVLVEENEALRKGMHEIMDSLNTKKGIVVAHFLCIVKSSKFQKQA